MAELSDVMLELEGRILGTEERDLWLQKAREKKLWNYQQTQVYEAQQLAGSLGKGVKVGIIDSGIDYNHEQFRHLQGRIEGVDVSESGSLNKPFDTFGHGTQVASTICGEEIGIAPEVDLYVVKIHGGDLKKDKEFDFVNTVNLGLRLCAAEGCDLINLSLGISKYNPLLRHFCREISQQGVLIVSSSGNRYTGANFPASFLESVINVGSLNQQKKYHSGNVWSEKDIVAPGENILIASINNQYHLGEGTSYSTSQVTGILALALAALKERKRSLNLNAIKKALRDTADQSIVDQRQAERFIEQYDPERRILKTPEQVAPLMFGTGLIQAKKLVERVVSGEYRL